MGEGVGQQCVGGEGVTARWGWSNSGGGQQWRGHQQ